MKPSLTTTITAVSVLGIAAIVYLFWNDISSWFDNFSASGANQTVDNNGNVVPTSLMDTLGNVVGPNASAFPGGEVQGTSETYTGALSETVSHPIDTLKTLLGF